jgi:phage head maturation protease
VTDTKQVKFAQVKTAESDNPNGEFEAVLSMATLDRDGEVIDAKAFDPLPDHITIDIDHGRTAATTVGSGQPFYDGDTLKIRGSFASTQLAQDIRSLVTEGHIRSMSVAFMDAKKQAKDGNQHITKAELLNAAFVAIPANREAVVLAAKSLQDSEEKAGARNNATDAGLIQEMHDMSISLGAVCSTKAAPMATTAPAADAADPEPGEDPNTSIQAVDAALDEALNLLNSVADSLPAEAQQALALLNSADAAMDDLLASLNLPDPDETRSAETTSDAAKAAPDADIPADTVPAEVKAALEARRNTLALL